MDLCNNAIGDAGARAIAKALIVNRSIRDLALGNNLIGDQGVRSLGAALAQNRGLRRLSLDLRMGFTGTSGARIGVPVYR